MFEEIEKILFQTSLNHKIFNIEEIQKIYKILINYYYTIEPRVTSIELTNNSDIDGIYKHNQKKILINIQKIIENAQIDIPTLGLTDNSIYIFYNTQILLVILHEIAHVRQDEAANSKGIIATLMFYGKTLGAARTSTQTLEEYKEYINKLYESTYDYNPCERDAYITSFKQTSNIIKDNENTSPQIKEYLSFLMLRKQAFGYYQTKDEICPTSVYFSQINNYPIWEALPFYQSNNTKMIKKAENTFTLEERLRYGLPIRKSDYKKIIKKRNELREKILRS